MYKPIRSVELVSGGNIIKQGEKFALTFRLFDEEGKEINATGKTVSVKIANKSGVVYETAAIVVGGLISFSVNEDIGHGGMRVELTVTSGSAVLQKYPADGWIDLLITPSLDDLSYGGVTTITVQQLKSEIAGMQNAYQVVVDGKVNTAEAKAVDALAKSTDAKTTAETVRTEFDAVVKRATDTDAMSRQAAINTDGVDELNLKARLDKEHKKVTTALADKANEVEAFEHLVPKVHFYGGQLAKIKNALSNPLEQFMSIVLIGDSITWGMTATGNPTNYNTGRDGTLSDIRDNYSSLSWVNKFKRYIGSKYSYNTNPVLSNWSASPQGDSIVVFNREHKLYPHGGDFKLNTTGTPPSPTVSVASALSLLGMQLQLYTSPTALSQIAVEFKFSGKEFTVSYDSVNNGSDYEIVIDGVSHGIFSTQAGVDGNTLGYDRRRTHKFTYVRDGIVQIKIKANSYDGVQTLKIAGIILNKAIKISNQGIIGINTRTYLMNLLEGNNKGDGVVLSSEDSYVIMQLGTNDRITFPGVAKGRNEFNKNLQAIIDTIKTNRTLVLMAANPSKSDDPATYNINMQDVRDTVGLVAQKNGHDFIDNYSTFGNDDALNYTADGLHPNDYGHKIIARNLINSLEMASELKNVSVENDSKLESKQGIWVPRLYGSTVAGSLTYTAQEGAYQKIGNLVFAQFRIVLSAKNDISGYLAIDGLPFNAPLRSPVTFGQINNLTFPAQYNALHAQAALKNIAFYMIGNGVNAVAPTESALINTTTLIGSIVYSTND